MSDAKIYPFNFLMQKNETPTALGFLLTTFKVEPIGSGALADFFSVIPG
jgi:hypothetical protein